MCGIVGFTGSAEVHVLRAANERLRHRGPDDEGYLTDPSLGVSLAMRRLSIIDPRDGQQPMSDAPGNLTVVFNGEIFNAPALRQNLEGAGHRFTTDHSDTEVLLALYERGGERMVEQLNGMFAFVILDRPRRRLFGARDRVGIKPLYYSHEGGRFSFASELRSLRVLPWINSELDRQAVYDYCTLQAVPAPASPYQGVRKLPPGEAFSVDLGAPGAIARRRYWRPAFDAKDAPRSDDEVVQFVSAELDAATRRWSLADVPVAISLSGGLDSSLIAASYARQIGPVSTFTLGFDDDTALDERARARLVARHLGTDHHEIVLSPSGLLAELGEMVDHLEEPYGGGIPSWFVFKAISTEAKVALTGVGGDELFGNYGKWGPHVSIKARLRRRLLRERPDGFDRWPAASMYWPRYLTDSAKRDWIFEPDIVADLRPTEDLIESLWQESPSADPRDAIAYVDLQQQLPNEFLHMVDRFSMAHSVEARTPMLDHEFVEAVLSIPPGRRTAKRNPKVVLRRIAADVLPSELADAPKGFFSIPYSRWLRGELRGEVQELLSPGYLTEQGLFRTEAWSRLVRPVIDGENHDDHDAQRVWTLYMFQRWFEHSIVRESV